MRDSIKLLILCLASCLAVFAVTTDASAAVRHCEITGFSVYPADGQSMNKLAGLHWPEVKQLNALVKVDIGGFSGEEKLDLFLVIFDENDEVVSKHKGKHFLAAGEHDCVFADFMSTEHVFGSRSFRAKVEASLKGCQPAHDSLDFDISGPDEPDVDILDMRITGIADGRDDLSFEPGEEFRIEAEFEIQGNESLLRPQLMFYAVMEEDEYLTDPDLQYQSYETQWDTLEGEGRNGIWRISAIGRLPYYFAEPYDFSHSFRLYFVVDFGSGARTMDYARAELQDYDASERRYSDDVNDRLIELDRSYLWEARRMRGDRPHSGRH